MTAGEGDSTRRVLRAMPGEAVDVALDLLRAEADGGERILDLVGDAARDLFPGGLLLRAKQLGGIFEHEDVAVMLAADCVRCRPTSRAGRRWREGSAFRRMVSRRLLISISLEAEPMRWLRLIRRSRTSTTSAGKTSSMARPRKGVGRRGRASRESAVGEDDAPLGVERGDAVGDGFEHGFELAAAGFKGGVGCGELDGGLFDGAAAVFKVGGHVVEAATSSPSSSVALSFTRCA